MGRVPLDPQALLAHADFVRALARTLVHDAARADDLAQETWVATLEHPPRTVGSSRGWLLAVLRNFARRFSRAEARRARWEGAAARPEPVPSSHEIVAREESRRRVVEAVLALEEPYRSAIVLRFYEDLPPRAIARRLGVPVETARTRIKRGLAHLRARLDGEWGGDRSAWCAALTPLAPRNAAGVPAVLGGIAMKASTKAAIAAALVLGLAVAFWPKGGVRAPEVARAPEGPPSTTSTNGSVPPETATSGVRQEPSAVPMRAIAEPRSVEEGEPRVSGRVVDPSGAPIARARVLSFPANLARLLRLSTEGETDPVSTAQTDAEGRFMVPVRGKAPSFGLTAEAIGFSPRIAGLLQPGEEVTLVLDWARTFSGSVMDLEGRPVGGARVRWLGLLATAYLELETVSSPDGGYRLGGIPSPRGAGTGIEWKIEVLADGFAPLLLQSPISPEPVGDARYDLRLIRGATLRGRAVDADTGTPIAGARIVLWNWEGRVGLSLGDGSQVRNPLDPRVLGETVAGSDGAYEFLHVPAAGFHRRGSNVAWGNRGVILGFVAAEAPGYASGSEPVPWVKDGETAEASVRLWGAAQGAARIRGRVVDRSGRPVAGAQVLASCRERGRESAAPWEGVGFPTAVTDGEGRYSLTNVPAGREPSPMKVFARAWGSNTGSSVEVAVRAAQEARVPDILLETDPWVDLLVLDPEDRPLWGATAWNPDLWSGPPPTTDESGRARVYFPKERSGPRRLIVQAHGHAAAETEAFVPSSEEPPQARVVLGRAHRLAGKVLLPDGGPASGVDVHVLHSAIPTERISVGTLEGSREDSGLPALRFFGFATSTEDGAFEVKDLPEGPCTLVAFWPWGSPERERSEVRALLRDVRTDARDVAFTVPAQGAAPLTTILEGTVTDSETGAPMMDFTATVTDGSLRMHRASKTAPGRFRVEAPSGTWSLRVAAEGFVPWEREGIEVGPGEAQDPIAVVLDRGVTVRGTVTGLPPVGDFTLRFVMEPRREGPFNARVERDGTYRATGFPPGSYRASLDGGRFLALAEPAELVVGEGEKEVRFDCTAAPGGTLQVRLRSARGEPPAGRTVETRFEVRDGSGKLVRHLAGRTGMGGAHYFTLVAGEYRVRAEVPGAGAGNAKVAISPETDSEVEIEIP